MGCAAVNMVCIDMCPDAMPTQRHYERKATLTREAGRGPAAARLFALMLLTHLSLQLKWAGLNSCQACRAS